MLIEIGLFPVSTIMNNVSVSILVHVLWWTYAWLPTEYKDGTQNTGPLIMHLFSRNCKKKICNNYIDSLTNNRILVGLPLSNNWYYRYF